MRDWRAGVVIPRSSDSRGRCELSDQRAGWPGVFLSLSALPVVVSDQERIVTPAVTALSDVSSPPLSSPTVSRPWEQAV